MYKVKAGCQKELRKERRNVTIILVRAREFKNLVRCLLKLLQSIQALANIFLTVS